MERGKTQVAEAYGYTLGGFMRMLKSIGVIDILKAQYDYKDSQKIFTSRQLAVIIDKIGEP